ncbi:MAG: dNTP triphosphohydrolase [Sphaerochaetaceae bacterium]|nr:dNTP triphosphohydrolase [Sphaerochaetaceae bacterium]
MNWGKLLNSERIRKSERITENDPRNEFESDFGRVIFSPATRRMHDKTQVMPLSADDNIHTRLTHSMEVMTIGYSLGIKLIENPKFKEISKIDNNLLDSRIIPMILKSAGLVHDIGNPPFGHFGEECIKNYFTSYFDSNKLTLSDTQMKDFTHFDGNAQGFRILTKLQILDDIYGLNLTKSTLSSYLKYPNTDDINKSFIHKKKRGVFQPEKDYLLDVANSCGLINSNDEIIRHPLSYLVEASDSLCYRIMDLEDGYNKGWYSINELKDIFGNNSVGKILRSIEGGNDTTIIVKFRIALMNKLTSHIITNFIDNYHDITQGKYNNELLEDNSDIDSILDDFCNDHIFPNRDILSLELTGNSVIQGLLDLYTNYIFSENSKYRNRALGMISSSIIRTIKMENKIDCEKWFEKFTDYDKLRMIVDYISGMTDQFALNHYQKLNGQKII